MPGRVKNLIVQLGTTFPLCPQKRLINRVVFASLLGVASARAYHSPEKSQNFPNLLAVGGAPLRAMTCGTVTQ